MYVDLTDIIQDKFSYEEFLAELNEVYPLEELCIHLGLIEPEYLPEYSDQEDEAL